MWTWAFVIITNKENKEKASKQNEQRKQREHCKWIVSENGIPKDYRKPTYSNNE